jgi:hypothetical protein
MLAPLFHLAQRHNLAVLILHHLQKRATRFADGSILGAGSFASVCRNVWHLIPDSADKDRRLLVPGKSNFARIAPALAFKVTTDEKTNAARIVWEDKPINIDADEALAKYACSKTGPDPICRVAAQNWLTDYLQNGPVDAQRIRTDACNAALAWRTVERAADYINIIRKRKSHNDWTWQLPANLLNIHCSAPGVARPEPSRREC